MEVAEVSPSWHPLDEDVPLKIKNAHEGAIAPTLGITELSLRKKQYYSKSVLDRYR